MNKQIKEKEFSIKAQEKYPTPIRGHYFTQKDFEAACVRVEKKRSEYDGIYKVRIKNGGKLRSVVINGVKYDSMVMASMILNIEPSTISMRVASDRFPSYGYANNEGT